MRTRVIVIAPDVSLRAHLGRLLTAAGYGVELAENAAHARRIGLKGLALSIVAPEGLGPEGKALVTELRTATKLLFTSASPGSLEASPDVLNLSDDNAVLARVAEALRPPSEDKPAQLLSFAGYSLDFSGHSLTDKDGAEIPLTRGEFLLLREFMERRGRVLSRDHLSNILNGRNAEAYDRSIDMLIVRLRRKIEADPKKPTVLVTVPGSGYKFIAKVQKTEALNDGRSPPTTQPRPQTTPLAKPAGWWSAGSHPNLYEIGLDRAMVCHDRPAAVIRALYPDQPAAYAGRVFATLMQSASAEAYLGKRVVLEAELRALDVTGAAALWLRIDKASGQTLNFDNMMETRRTDRSLNGPLKGSQDWTSCRIVLDVADEAASLNYGFLLAGPGTAWAAGFKLAEVGVDVPQTNTRSGRLKAPDNLDFARDE